jgi:hypothetical protein
MASLLPPASLRSAPLHGFFRFAPLQMLTRLATRPRRGRQATPRAAAKAATRAATGEGGPAAARTVLGMPRLELLEWDGDRELMSAVDAQVAVSGATHDAKRRRIRDRYIRSRFPGVAESAADLRDAHRVIKSARLYFEDGRDADALELLDVALEEHPAEPALGLARLEILFLLRDAARFVAAARAFRREHGSRGQAWDEICRLGAALAPEDEAFGVAREAGAHDQYGPWPHTPNWIEAPWDLTNEIAAADFHHAMRRLAGGDRLTQCHAA